MIKRLLRLAKEKALDWIRSKSEIRAGEGDTKLRVRKP